MKDYGRVHAIYGNGKGKTSAAIGMAIRAAGAGLSVGFIQFMKGGTSSEVSILRGIDKIDYFCPGDHEFILPDRKTLKAQRDHSRRALDYVRNLLTSEDMIVCDELLNAVIFDLVDADELRELIDDHERDAELVMTGLYIPVGIPLELFDYRTEMKRMSHPYPKLKARYGIEF
ncbi:MAG: cob(I)yrinic acid a,c-diamide adenosyltransferase [Candidatus Aenigmatarchaeota archaeon]